MASPTSPTAPAPSSLAVPGRAAGPAPRRGSAMPQDGAKADKPPHGGASQSGEPREREKVGELRSHVDMKDFKVLRLKAQEATRVPLPLKKHALPESLRETIAKMRTQVDTLMSQQDRRNWRQDAAEHDRNRSPSKGRNRSPGRMPEASLKRKCAGAPPDADHSLAKLRQMHRRRHRSSLLYDNDDSEDSSDEEGAEKEEEAGSPQDDEEEVDSQDGQDDDDEALGRDAVAAAIAADQAAEEQWDMKAARDHVQALMSGLHVEERVNVLEDLKHYFNDKLEFIQDDTKKINDFEQDASEEMTTISQAANNLTSSIDDREHLAYRCLWNYYTTLQKQIHHINPLDKKAHLEEIREQLLAHARHKTIEKLTGKSNDQSVAELLNIKNRLPEDVTPPEVLAAVASVQDDISLLKESIEFDLRRKASYEHTLDLLMREGLGKIAGDEIATQVIQDVRQWASDRSQNDEGTTRLQRQMQSRSDELSKLTDECEKLRLRVENQEREAAQHLERDKKGYDPRAQRFSGGPANALWLHHDKTQSASNQYSLFTEEASETFKKEFRALHEENVKIEEQLAQFQELEGLAKTAVTVLQDNTERFVEAAAQARRNLQVGSLPDDDEEDDDSKLLKELKGIDENLIKKQDEDHKAEMQKLEAKAAQLRADVAHAEEERERLGVQIEKERKRQESTLSEILNVEAKHKEAQEELNKLPQLNLDEDEQKLERLNTENARLALEVEGARRNLTMAMRRKELNGQALEQSRDLASKVLNSAKKDDSKLEEDAEKQAVKEEEKQKEREEEEQRLVQEDAWKALQEQMKADVEKDDKTGGGKDGKDDDGEKPAGTREGSLGAILALKKSANLWRGKAKNAPKVSAEVQKYLDEEQRDNEEAAKYQAKTLRLHKQIAAMEAWAKQAKAGLIMPDLPQEEASPEVVHLRKKVKSKKKELQGMRAHWWNVRELAKRGARIPTGKEAIEIRNAIVNICDEALIQVGRDPKNVNESWPGNESPQPSPRPEGAEGAEVTKNDDVGSRPDEAEASSKDDKGTTLLDVLLG
mmetsp:Transcript_82081/g.143157  ORF Transcript_82081/g.143157 Transcript_82081/m.143157 type:complete len:1045 (-) Transcript_82081:26-3160(-)